MNRPPYRFSVWIVIGAWSDRLVSTFTREEADEWLKYLSTVYTDHDSMLQVRNYDY
jgi:hypothetical protein